VSGGALSSGANFIWLVLFLFVCSCSPGYVLRAAYEEGKILWRRKPIAAMLRKVDLDPALREKFETVIGVREFAREKLRLRVGGSYTSYSYVDRPVLSHLLTAVPKTEFEPYTWWFLLVGSVPYKGYFDRSDAEHEAQELEGEGYDTHIRPVAAFSTLGWFDDPLLEHLLRLNRVALTDVILHELLHNTLFVSGSVAFNETLANFVGKRGALQYFTERYGRASPEAKMATRHWHEEQEFSRFVMKWVECLKQLYGKELPELEKLRRRDERFEEIQEAWRHQIADRPDHLHRRFGQTNLNNAVLMQHYLYVNNLELFEKLYERTGGDLREVIEQIGVVTKSAEPPYESLAKRVYGSQAHTSEAQVLCPARISHSVGTGP